MPFNSTKNHLFEHCGVKISIKGDKDLKLLTFFLKPLRMYFNSDMSELSPLEGQAISINHYSIFRWVGGLLVAFGLVAALWEILGYGSWLIYYGHPIGGILGVLGCILGTMVITIPPAIREIQQNGRSPLKVYVAFIDNFSENLGIGVGWFTTIMVIVVFVNVMLRYLFGRSLLALQDMSWYVFGVVFMIGAAYTLKHDRHVRVDVFYANYSPKRQVWVNFLGSLIFLVPFCLLGIYVSWGFVERSFLIQEISSDPGGLSARYLAKMMTPLGFFLVLLQGISLAFRSLLQLIGQLPIEQKEGGAH